MARSNVPQASKLLRDALEQVLLSGEPEDYAGPDDQAIGVVLNDWRVVLARLHAVHNSQGRHTGWGINLDEQVARLRAWQAARQARNEEEPEIPSDDDEQGSPPTRQRKRA